MTAHDRLLFDARHIWHPYSRTHRTTLLHEVISAKGVWLTLSDGRQVVDGMASWWSVIHGYNHPRLNQVLHNQVEQMAHVMFGGLTHQPAIELARRLIAMTADPLQNVFFADSGSVSVEVAIKMAVQYWFAQQQPQKQRLLTIRNGYHGDTFGAMAVCDPDNGMHHLFAPVLAKHLFAPAPRCREDADWQDSEIATFRQLLHNHHQEIAAVILEPLVQGAGGMRFYCPEYLRQVRHLCDDYQVLLILDEIATGFGRSGSLFAYEQAGITPDILCLGKALTGGMMTLAATLCTDTVAEKVGVLMHGPTFMANPLACRVACESIDLLLESNWHDQVQMIEQQLRAELSPYQSLPNVRDVRVKGAIGVVELNAPLDEQMDWLPEFIIEQGVWIRPFRNLIYIMPPYVITRQELRQLTQAIGHIIQRLQTSLTS